MTSSEKKKILIIGAEGYLGSYFYEYFIKIGYEVQGTSRRAASSFFQLDLFNLDFKFLNSLNFKPDFALVCAAVPNIVKCEDDPLNTFKVNVLNTLNLCRVFHENGIKPIVFSSDVVFDGSLDKYEDNAPLSPLNTYGKQKSYLEQLLPEVCGENFCIIRLTKTYSIDKQDNTLLHELSKKLMHREPIRAAYDLIFNPLCISDLSHALTLLIDNNCKGIYNLCGTESTSWYDLSRSLANSLQITNPCITPISIEDLQSNIQRAKRVNLQPSRFLSEFPHFKFTKLNEAVNQIAKNYTLSTTHT